MIFISTHHVSTSEYFYPINLLHSRFRKFLPQLRKKSKERQRRVPRNSTIIDRYLPNRARSKLMINPFTWTLLIGAINFRQRDNAGNTLLLHLGPYQDLWLPTCHRQNLRTHFGYLSNSITSLKRIPSLLTPIKGQTRPESFRRNRTQ